jgi:hypothetical protein
MNGAALEELGLLPHGDELLGGHGARAGTRGNRENGWLPPLLLYYDLPAPRVAKMRCQGEVTSSILLE